MQSEPKQSLTELRKIKNRRRGIATDMVCQYPVGPRQQPNVGRASSEGGCDAGAPEGLDGLVISYM